MDENFKWMAAAVAVVGLSIGAVVYLSRKEKVVPVEEPPAAAIREQPAMPEEPAVKHPLAEPEVKQPLPPLDQSDEPMQLALEDLLGKESVQRFIVSKDLVRHIVVSVDNLSTEKVAERIRPVSPTPGKFAVGGSEEAPVLDPANYQRYKPLVELVQSMDTKRLVATYTHHYPLFQEAYESLGHPPQYFNDRLVEVIDHLLATPDLKGPIELARPAVQYEYADRNIEARSAGQKALIRMGSDNATAIKSKLRELRAELIAHQPAN